MIASFDFLCSSYAVNKTDSSDLLTIITWSSTARSWFAHSVYILQMFHVTETLGFGTTALQLYLPLTLLGEVQLL